MLIPFVVSRYYKVMVAQGVGYEGSLWCEGSKQLWQWVRTVTRLGHHNLVVHRHDTIFKAHHTKYNRIHYGFLITDVEVTMVLRKCGS